MNICKAITGKKSKALRSGWVLLLVVAGTSVLWAQGRQTNRSTTERPIKPADGEYTVLSKPLDPTDPHAQLPFEFRNVAAKPLPKVNRIVEADAVTHPEALDTVEYDMTTGQVAQHRASEVSEAVKALVKNGKGTIPGSPGANFDIDASDETASPVKTEGIYGPDDRVRVTPTTSAPWRSMTRIYFTGANGAKWVCSGAMIGPKHVLTAAHCVYDPAYGDYVKSASVIPGQDFTTASGLVIPIMPYGQHKTVKSRVFLGWLLYQGTNQRFDHDAAVLTLDNPIGNTTGWLGLMGVENGQWKNDWVLRTAGYPVDKDSGLGLYRTQTEPGIYDPLTYQIYTRIDSFDGQSGSPLYLKDGNSHSIVGVLSYDLPEPYANTAFTRLYSARVQMILNWMASD